MSPPKARVNISPKDMEPHRIKRILVALLLLTNLFAPLALALLAPIVVGIITFHIAIALATIVPVAIESKSTPHAKGK